MTKHELAARKRLDHAVSNAELCVAEVSAARDRVPFLIVLEATLGVAKPMLDDRAWKSSTRNRAARALNRDMAEVYVQFRAHQLLTVH